MYTGVLQANLPQSDLLQLLLLADRFDVGRALAAARRGLASLSPECFEWTTLNGGCGASSCCCCCYCGSWHALYNPWHAAISLESREICWATYLPIRCSCAVRKSCHAAKAFLSCRVPPQE